MCGECAHQWRGRARPRRRSARRAWPACRDTRARAETALSRSSLQPRTATRPRTRRRSPDSRREPFAPPSAASVGTVTHPVVKTIGAPLPAFELVDSDDEPTPERRQREIPAREPRLDLGHPPLELVPADNVALRRRPRAHAMTARAAVPVARSIDVGDPRDRADDAHLPLLFAPVEYQRRARVGGELRPLRALQVREEHEATLLE